MAGGRSRAEREDHGCDEYEYGRHTLRSEELARTTLAASRSVPGWALCGGGGASDRAGHLLLRLDRWWRLEDHRWWRDLGERLRWLLRPRLGRSAGRQHGRSQRPLCRAGGSPHPGQRLPWRWGLHEHRWGRALDPWWARRDAEHQPGAGRSARCQAGLRGGLGACPWTEPGAGHLPLDGWWRVLGPGPPRERSGGSDRSDARCQPPDSVRGLLGGGAETVPADQWGTGEWHLALDRRGRDLGGADA